MTTLLHARMLGLALLATASMVFAGSPSRAVSIVITYTDPAGYGFNDNTTYIKAPFSPSNPGTLGAARRAAMEAAAHNWGQRLKGTVPVTVEAAFEALGGTPTGAVLASAGPNYVMLLSGGGLPQTWFNAAGAAQLLGTNSYPGTRMISATFNSDIGSPNIVGGMSFYYGLAGQAGNREIDFYATTIHELGHGLGFNDMLEFAQSSPGVYMPTGGYLRDGGGTEHPGMYDRFIATAPGAGAQLLVNLTPSQRLPLLTSNSLYFSGAETRGYNGGNSAKLYAPNPFEPGSSISHLDESTYSGSGTLNEMMTPIAGPSTAHSPGPLVTGIMKDILWEVNTYTMADAVTALRAAGGLTTPTEANLSYLNVAEYTTFPNRIDLKDALKIVRMASGAERNPNP